VTHRPGWKLFAIIWLVKGRSCWGFSNGHIIDVVRFWHFFVGQITNDILRLWRPDKKEKKKWMKKKLACHPNTVILHFHDLNQEIFWYNFTLNYLGWRYQVFVAFFWLSEKTKNVENLCWRCNFWVSTSWQIVSNSF